MADFHRIGVQAARQPSIDDRRAAEAGPNRQIDHIPAAARHAKGELAECCRVGVFLHPHRQIAAQSLAHTLTERHVHPAEIDGVVHDARLGIDLAGAADPDSRDRRWSLRPQRLNPTCDLVERRGDVFGARRELLPCQNRAAPIHQRQRDFRPADVDPHRQMIAYHLSAPRSFRRKNAAPGKPGGVLVMRGSASADDLRCALEARVGELVVLVGAARAELRDDSAFRPALEPVPRLRHQGVLIAGLQHDLVPDGVILFATHRGLAFGFGVGSPGTYRYIRPTGSGTSLLAWLAIDRGMQVLRAGLTRQQNKLFGAHPLVLTYVTSARPVFSYSPRPRSAISMFSRSSGVRTIRPVADIRRPTAGTSDVLPSLPPLGISPHNIPTARAGHTVTRAARRAGYRPARRPYTAQFPADRCSRCASRRPSARDASPRSGSLRRTRRAWCG